jgi:hypothetical protein
MMEDAGRHESDDGVTTNVCGIRFQGQNFQRGMETAA